MTMYRSKPTEVEAMRWATEVVGISRSDWLPQCGARIVAWVNANGGKARYEPKHLILGLDGLHPRIAVRTINGWAYAAPGYYVVRSETLPEACAECTYEHPTVTFSVVPAAEFEQRWERSS